MAPTHCCGRCNQVPAVFVRSKPCPATSAEADGLFLLGPNLTSRKTTTTQPTQVHCCRRQGSPWLRGGVVADKRKGCVARTTSKTMPPPPVTFPIFTSYVPPRTFCGAASGRFRRFPADFGQPYPSGSSSPVVSCRLGRSTSSDHTVIKVWICCLCPDTLQRHPTILLLGGAGGTSACYSLIFSFFLTRAA